MENSTSETVAPPPGRRLQHPVVLCLIVAILLAVVGDQYPLSPFPMYSNIENSTNVLFLTNEKDEPIAMSPYFDVGSAQGKKRFEDLVQRKSKSKTRNHLQATEEEVATAGKEFLEDLWKECLKKKARQEKLARTGAKEIRVKMRNIRVNDDGSFDTENVREVARMAVNLNLPVEP